MGHITVVAGVVERGQHDRNRIAASGRRAPRRLTFDPVLHVPLGESRDRQRAAVFAELVQATHDFVTIVLTDRAARLASPAILDVLGTDLCHQPLTLQRRLGGGTPLAGHFAAGQRQFRSLTVPGSANPLPVFVHQRYPPFGSRWSVVPRVGLFPVPGRTTLPPLPLVTHTHVVPS